MTPLASYRAERGLTLEQMAVELELSAKSRGWLSEIERGVTDASLRLALRIQRWSGGKVTAGSVCKELAEHDAAPVADAATLTGSGIEGAEKIDENVSRTAVAA
jgi:transcriptional regulator with XRE-family HTH domain